MTRFTYDPRVFEVESLDKAKEIILTPEDSTTEARWETETPYLLDLMSAYIDFTPDSLVLDYGCGVGRMAKALIDRFGCSVVGIDSSTTMTSLAVRYVGTERFTAAQVYETRQPYADAAIAVWALQHMPHVTEDVVRILRALKPGGHLFIANLNHRCVPTVESGWIDDGIDVFALLGSVMTLVARGPLDPAMTTKRVAAVSGWAVYRR